MDSLLHVDGLFAIASFAAILALAVAAASRPDAMAPWLAAGALAACAWMTRATGLSLVAVVAGLAAAQLISRWRMNRHSSLREVLEGSAFGVMLWVTGAGAVSLVVLPSLWVDPFGTILRIWDWSSNAATDGHERPTFFLGEIHDGDPGLLFYPVTLLWRLTPTVLLGVGLLPVLLLLGVRRGWLCREHLRTLAIMTAFAVLYVAAMSVGAKKFDRYILPVYPIASVLASVGMVLFARWVSESRPGWRSLPLPLLAAALVLGQFASLVTALPYRLDYFNPVLGGVAQAQHSVPVGWGEGGGEAMAFIVDDADGEEVVVQMSSVTPVLSYFATPNIRFDDFGLSTPAGWYETDYFVVGIQEWQRDLSPSYALMQRYEPEHVVEIHGVPFFKVYAPSRLVLPEELLTPTACNADFGGEARLMQVIGRDGTIDLYWLGTGDASHDLEVEVTMVSPEGVSGAPQVATLALPEGGRIIRVTIDDPRSDGDAPLHRYRMMVTVRDSSRGAGLPIMVGGNPVEGDAFETHSECFYE